MTETTKAELRGLTQATAPEVKIQYLTSKILGVKEYILSIPLLYNDNTIRLTKGWREEKEQMIEEIAVRAIESVKKESAKRYVPDVTELFEMKKSSISLLKARLNQIVGQAKDYIAYVERMQKPLTDKQREELRVNDKNVWKRWRNAPKEVNSGEIILILTAIKRELGEPLTIIKNTNGSEMEEELTEDEAMLVDALDTQEALMDVERKQALPEVIDATDNKEEEVN